MNSSANERLQTLSKLPAVAEALTLLRNGLPATLFYHAYTHTEDVICEGDLLASMDALSDRDRELLAVAAAWHDIGFIHSRQGNEPIGAKLAREFLVSLSRYSQQEISLIEQMILDTALVADEHGVRRQIPSTSLSRYLLDADLANFGRDDFFEKSDLLRREVGEDLNPFRRETLLLVENHSWLTPAAEKLWGEKKRENVERLRELVAHPTHS